MNNQLFWTAIKLLTAREFVMYSVLEKLSDNEVGYCFATNDSIAEKLGIDPTNVSKAISALKKKGVLFSIEQKNGMVITERRLYVDKSSYERDLKNKDFLVKTIYINKNGVAYYYNELNPKEEKKSLKALSLVEMALRTDGEIANGTDGEIANGTDGEIANGTDGEIAKVNNTNINKLNKNKKDVSDSSKNKEKIVYICNDLLSAIGANVLMREKVIEEYEYRVKGISDLKLREEYKEKLIIAMKSIS